MILDFLAEQATQYSKKDNVIFDRCVLDNLAYSSWLHLKDKVSEKFLDESRILTRETLRLLDVILFLPITNSSPVTIVNDSLRDTNPQYREEVDNIFKAFQQSYHQEDGRIFPQGDAPPIIEIFGNQEQRIELTKLYITPEGKPYGEEQSLIATP
jgi:predicted ATPase